MKSFVHRSAGIWGCIFVVCSHAAHGASENPSDAVLFEQSVDYPTGSFPSVCQAHDFNGDGFIDIVVANRNDDNVMVFWNDGDGSFPSTTTLATGPMPRGMVVADYDGDMIKDIAVANFDNAASTVSVILSNGDGTFDPFFNITSGLKPRFVDAGDLDNNGTMDLASADLGDDTMSVMLNSGAASFAAPVAHAANLDPGSISIGHLNNDAWLDIVIANRFGYSMGVYLNNGDGTFAAGVEHPAPEFPRDQTIVDVDDDGDNDLAVALGFLAANPETFTMRVWLNDGNGVFSEGQTKPVGNIPHGISHADLNCDGAVDLVVGSTGARIESVLLGNGDGTFQDAIDFDVGGSGTYNAVADLNGDGYPDIINAGASTNMMSVLINRGPVEGVPGDLDNNCIVGASDLAALLGLWGPCAAAPAECNADLDGSGDVGAADLAELIGRWGETCEVDGD